MSYFYFISFNSFQDLFLILSDLGEEDRLIPRVGMMKARAESLIKDRSKADNRKKGVVHREEIDELSQKHFPPCMQVMHKELTEKHHLRHFARIQYGLFLKGIGLPAEEALLFFRDHFTRGGNMTAEQFQRNYAYGVRYNYGLEGRRTDFSPYSCNKIIQSSRGAGDCHGCPFQYMTGDQIRAMAIKSGVQDEIDLGLVCLHLNHRIQLI